VHLPAEPLWLAQVHGIEVVRHEAAAAGARGDASVAFAPGRVCAVMTADCLPVVFADRGGTRVGVSHAGWRGLVGGVLQATMAALEVPASRLYAWLGPAIGPEAFEVGPEVREAYRRGVRAVRRASVATSAGIIAPTCTNLRRSSSSRPGWRACMAAAGAPTARRSDSFRSAATASPAAWATLAWLA